MICGHAQIVGLAPSLGAPSMTSYSLGLPALWPDDSIGMDAPSPGDPAVSAALRTYHCSPRRSERTQSSDRWRGPRSDSHGPVRLQLLFRHAGCCRIRMVRMVRMVRVERVERVVRVGGVVER